MTSTVATESPLATFLSKCPNDATTLRTLANVWQSGGGHIAVGSVAIRLQFGPEDGRHTAGTLTGGEVPKLELARVILNHHGLSEDQWTQWTGEFAELAHHGFDPLAKYPTLPLTPVTPAELARLASGMRDLATLVC